MRVGFDWPPGEPHDADMAQKTIVELTDDVDGEPAAETVTFALDGVAFEIDLSTKNADELRRTLEPWTGAARKVTTRAGRNGRTTVMRPADVGVDNKAVRAWARSNGVELSSRGRIPAEIVERYRAAGN
jgi:hypothetical protein